MVLTLCASLKRLPASVARVQMVMTTIRIDDFGQPRQPVDCLHCWSPLVTHQCWCHAGCPLLRDVCALSIKVTCIVRLASVAITCDGAAADRWLWVCGVNELTWRSQRCCSTVRRSLSSVRPVCTFVPASVWPCCLLSVDTLRTGGRLNIMALPASLSYQLLHWSLAELCDVEWQAQMSAGWATVMLAGEDRYCLTTSIPAAVWHEWND